LFVYEGDPLSAKNRPPHVALKLIDFAHAIPKADKEGEGDDGVLMGLRNLALLFQSIATRHALQQQHQIEEEEEEAKTKDQMWSLSRSRERDLLASRCKPIAPLMITSSPMKAENY